VTSAVAGPRNLAAALVVALSAPVVHAADVDAKDGAPPVLASALAAEPAAATESAPGIRAEELATPDPGVAPARWVSSYESTARGYRVSLSRGALDLGLHFETPSSRGRAFEAASDPVGPTVSVLPSLSFGLRQGGAAPAGSLLERSLGTRRSDNYVSKVGVEWKPAESRVNFLREGLGIRLEGNDRMTVRLRKGVIGIYMHRKF